MPPSESRAEAFARSTMEIFVPSLVIVYGLVFFFSVGDLDSDSSLYPRIVSVIIVLLALANLWGVSWRRRVDDAPSEEDYENLQGSWVKLVVGIGATVAYMILMEIFGFYVATALYAFALSLTLGWPSGFRSAVFAIFLTGTSYVAFSYLMDLRLPSGIWF